MCGIAGIWGNGDIKAMTQILKHRGPDDEGYYEGSDIKLGIRRLSVIDLETGHQPIHNEDETVWVVFNGEIFNYIELRDELEKKGHRFYTKSDTEVIVHAYEEYGIDCLQKFIGMFAFAIWDTRKKNLFIARDRLGEKPLYYYWKNNLFLFASEIKSIVRQIDAEPDLDEDFWVFETAVNGKTLFRDIFELLPASYMIYDGQKLAIKKYWDIPNGFDTYHKESYYIEKLRWLIEDAVKLRLRSDVPVGVYLSGGIDSAAIACIAKPDKVFSCRYPYGEKYDEYHYAQLLADYIGAEHFVVQPTSQDFKEEFPKIIWHLDQPIATPSPISEFMLARLASKHVKVVLGGQGADEIFGGYVRYVIMLEEDRLSKVPILKNYIPLMKFFWSEDMFDDPEKRYFDMIKRAEPKSNSLINFYKECFRKGSTLIDRMGICDLNITFPSLITMNDRAAAAYGLENRTPFLDHRIVEFAFQLPPEFKVKDYQTKYVLRQAMRGIVPDEIINRQDKKGLAVPIYHWFNNDLKDWVNSLKSSLLKRGIRSPLTLNNRGEFDRRDYSSISLEIWYRIFIDRR
ncbi:MAG: asparagine synthase (glutamine-hydrolyzing) [Candidatus Nitrosotenuis sp.]